MTTSTSTTFVDHTTDANFRLWGQVFRALMTGCGMTQTGDTGQINWASVVRAGANAEAGFEIFAFADSLQATAPIFIRIGYGTAAATDRPRLQVTVGTSTNGAGVIGGSTITIRDFCTAATPGVAGAYLHRSCHVAGALAVMFAAKSTNTNINTFAWMLLSRSIDANGAPTADGFALMYGGSNASLANIVCRNISPSITSAASTVYCMVPLGLTNSLVGGALQVFKHYNAITPRVRVNPFVLTYIAAEIGVSSTFTATVVAATSRTYITLSGLTGYNNDAQYQIAMIWE